MHFVLFLELLICLFSCLFSPVCCVVFSPCHVLFLITSGRFLHPHLLIKSANRQVNNFILPHKLLWLTCLPSAQNIFIQTESSSHSPPKLAFFHLYPTYSPSNSSLAGLNSSLKSHSVRPWHPLTHTRWHHLNEHTNTHTPFELNWISELRQKDETSVL